MQDLDQSADSLIELLTWLLMLSCVHVKRPKFVVSAFYMHISIFLPWYELNMCWFKLKEAF